MLRESLMKSFNKIHAMRCCQQRNQTFDKLATTFIIINLRYISAMDRIALSELQDWKRELSSEILPKSG